MVARKLLTPLLLAAWASLGCGGSDSGTGPAPVAPVITVEGVQEGGVYDGPVTIRISVDRGSYEAVLNGQPFNSGSVVSLPGSHVLRVDARNGTATASREVRFTIGGTATGTLDVATWNLEWFGDPVNGPTNDRQQMINAATFMAGAEMDVWGLQEMVSQVWFDSLKARLPGYDGFLANDPRVTFGPQYYSDFNNTEQKVGLVYRTAVATLVPGSARIVLGQTNNSDFAGRPPLEARLRITLNNATEEIVVLVLHMKADAQPASYQQRVNASNALKAYLDATWPTQKVFVIGDWNDDLDTSITLDSASPYANFVGDGVRYAFPTMALTQSRTPTWSNSGEPIDHHLVSNEAFATYVAGSAQAVRRPGAATCDDVVTSDHCAVFSRYRWPN